MKQVRISIATILFLLAGAATAQEDISAPMVVPERAVGSDTQDQVFTIVENMPAFPGGEEAMFKYLGQNIKYPETAVNAGIQGTVYLTFVVDTNGSIRDAHVLRGIGGGCDEEALRVVNGMPLWVPGMQRGKAVKVQYNLPIRFTMTRDETAEPAIVQEPVVERGNQNGVFTIVEKMPEFPGGQEAMIKYLSKNIKYPEAAVSAGIQGAVYVSFTVDADGAIRDAEVMRGIGGGCDEEALRVVNSMPLWEPGMQRGEAVKVKYRMPIRFRLRDEQLEGGKKK